jgi:hypothetical protein
MAVLITAEVPGQTKEAYDGMLSVLEGPIKATPGFILHAAYESDGRWHVRKRQLKRIPLGGLECRIVNGSRILP